MERKQVVIVGGGPAGLMAADILSLTHHVSVFDKEKNIGQKFLLAGKGGFNLCNSAEGEELKSKYSPVGFMNAALSAFDTKALRQWLSNIGIQSFIGSSGRVFPERDIKPIDVLNKIKAKLSNQGVVFYTQHEFVGVDNCNHVRFKNKEQEVIHEADYIIVALGGASWPITGSNGRWQAFFQSLDIVCKPFQSSNCGINISWPENIKLSHAGKPIKNIKLFTENIEVKGEALITEYGLEGNAVYPLIPAIRNELNVNNKTSINIDFKPLNTEEQLLKKIIGRDSKTKDYEKVLNLNIVEMALLKAYTSKEQFLSVNEFVKHIKRLEIPVESLRPIEEAISTVGGIDLSELNDDFSLKKYPWIYTIGEMVDWDAPTGGFLLQGCFSMGHYAAQSILKKSYTFQE